MDRPEHLIVGAVDKLPSRLCSACDLATAIEKTGMTEQRIIELAEAGYMPHYRIDGGEFLFVVTECKHWIANNLLSQCRGNALPSVLAVVVSPPELQDAPPHSISSLPLRQISTLCVEPCVYFLCLADSVEYVGQSTNPAARIGQHVGVKRFDRVYVIPTPRSELNDVESAFIQLLDPPQQGRTPTGRPVCPTCINYMEIVNRYTQGETDAL